MADQLVEALDGAAQQRVLVLGAGGGVGTFTTQLLAGRGAEVLGTDSVDKFGQLREFGVTVPLDPTRPLVEQLAEAGRPGAVDAVVDLVGGAALATAARLLRPGGPVASSMQPPQAVLGPDAVGAMVVVQPDGARLDRLARMVDDGRLRVPPTVVVAFDEALDTIRALSSGVRGAGKTAVEVR
jgi:NADPH:quinone reductase-like Zn-dependent oxidoreductase